MSNDTRRHVKACAAIIGGSALIAIGAISAATVPASGPDLAKSTTMSIGATSTETTPANAPAVAEARPKIKGPAPLPSEEESAK
ncbi:hypothetical protein [Mycolicibacterium sediminis]|uniref:Uncharacterized protein n=1 Tax=Mycolicibacterium sediminis TaxID=1286180 RepID=A0A7I7QZ97_9MYCO|nr:hypothetical protein [Mycolicibacterium sediminis]BBY31160.1 hypothetical protein MSEDJ_52560 [Mycolicibacterium sediminis]